MAQWDFEGAYLHWEPGEQTCHAETEPIPWKHQGAGARSSPCPLCHGPCGEGGVMTQGLVPLPGTLQPCTLLPLQL